MGIRKIWPERHRPSIVRFRAREILRRVKVKPEAVAVVAHTQEGYTTNILLSELDADDALLAVKHDGRDLPAEHGGPCRLVGPVIDEDARTADPGLGPPSVVSLSREGNAHDPSASTGPPTPPWISRGMSVCRSFCGRRRSMR